MTKYNGWTNYATWRINLEIFDGFDITHSGWGKLDIVDLMDASKDYVEELLDMDSKGLAVDYARAFVSDVNWHEIAVALREYAGIDDKWFHVVGIDENDGNATILEQFTNSGEARQWMLRYVAKENAGNWKHIEVLDTRDECAETMFRWEAVETIVVEV
jgi:hypothetical protein